MIDYTRHTLNNGLRLIVHHDPTTPQVVVNTVYDVGSRDESPDRTGLAHLLEHLMFGGSTHIPDFDLPLLKVGGSNNAFTGPDYTDYYIQLPADNLETAFWLESDRMSWLAPDQAVLDKERNVVIEEYRQQYLNRPYGDVQMLLNPLIYTVHPYRWPTIGKDIDHIRDVTLEEVRDFYARYYHPANAILSVAGPVMAEEIIDRVEHWYSDIPKGKVPTRSLPVEPKQTEQRRKTVERLVPQNALYLSWQSPALMDPDFFRFALLAEVLSGGPSARFHRHLVKGEKRFSELSAFVRNSFDPGNFTVSGMLNPETDPEIARESILAEFRKLTRDGLPDRELQKVKNNVVFNQTINEVGVLSKAMNLGYFELLGDIEMINTYVDGYLAVSVDEIIETARILSERPFSELYYRAAEVDSSTSQSEIIQS